MKKWKWSLIIIVVALIIGGIVWHKTHQKKALGSTVSIWVVGEEPTNIAPLMSEFEKQNPGVTVVVQYVPWDSAVTKLLTAILSNTTPDISIVGSTDLAYFQSLGVLENLKPYMESPNSLIHESDFIPSTIESNQYSGGTYGLPWIFGAKIAFYRTDLMEQAGFDTFPTTWEGVEKLCEAEKQNGVKYPVLLPFNSATIFYSFLHDNNTGIINASGNSLVATPQFKVAAEQYLTFNQKGLAPLSVDEDSAQLFAEGQVGILFANPWEDQLLDQAAGTAFRAKWSTALVPGKNGSISDLGGNDLVMFKASKNKENAFKLMAFLTSPEIEYQYYKETGIPPTNIKGWDYLPNTPFNQVAKQQVYASVVQLNIPQNEKLESQIVQSLQNVIYKQQTLDQALSSLNIKVNKIMKNEDDDE